MKKKISFAFLAVLALLTLLNVTKNASYAPLPWMKEQIKEDMNFYSAEDLSSKKLRDYFEQASPYELLVYYQIKGNKLYWKRNWNSKDGLDRVRKTTRMLDRMTKTRKLPDVEFILTVHDGFTPSNPASRDMPIFCYAKTEREPGVLFPDPLSEGFSRHSRKSIARANKRQKYAWRNKKDIAFWRGGTTGGKFEMDNWYNYPRSKLSLVSKYYPDLVDSGFTTYPGVSQDVQREMQNNLPNVSWTVHKDHLNYKYLVVPDGNTCTYPRYYLGLFSNSVVFKQKSDQVQWYYRALVPFEHYVPIDHDFSNLPETVSWAKKNDLKMKMISREATEFVNQNLLPKHIYTYVETLLGEYAQKQHESSSLYEGMQLFSSLKEKD